MDFKLIQRMVALEYEEHGFVYQWDNMTPHWAGDLAELALIHTEVSEACEAVRDSNLDHLAEELADIVIRIMNMATRKNIDLERSVLDKHQRNVNRPKLHGRKNV